MRFRTVVTPFLALLATACVDKSESEGAIQNRGSEPEPSAGSRDAAYVVFNYEISNREAYNSYLMQVPETLGAYGAEVLVADYESDVIEGAAGQVTVVLRFDSKETALDWYRSPEYQEIIGLRTAASHGIASLADAAKN